MDLWDHIHPYASSNGSRYGNPVSNFGTPNKTNANQTSRCIWGPADKSSPQTHNHPLNNAIQEGELSCSCSVQRRWEKTNKYVGGISCTSTKNSMLCRSREPPSSYTARCQWENEEVPPSDTNGKEGSSYRSPWKKKNDCNSRNNVAAEQASGLPSESRLACRRSLFDMDYETETELQIRDYHSSRNHNNVAESKLKSGSNCDGLDYVGGIKSDYDNLPEIRLQERDHHDLKKCDYYSEKSDDDIDRLGKDYSSSDKNYVVDMELAKRNNQLKRKHDCGHETQLRRRDADNKKQPEKREELVGMRKALVSLVPGEAALSTLSIPQSLEIEKPIGQLPKKGKKRRRRKGVGCRRVKLPCGRVVWRTEAGAIALELRLKRADVTHATGDKQSENLHDKSNGNKNDQLEKGEDVSHTTDDNVTKSHLDKEDNHQDKSYHDKNNINILSFLEQREKIKEGFYTTESCCDKKDIQDKSYHNKNNINIWSYNNNSNKKDQLEKEEEVSHTADDYVIKSRRDKKDNRQDMNYRDKNNRNKNDELEKREKVCHTADYVTKPRRDKQDNCQDKNYSDKNNRNKKEELEKREEVSHTTDDYVTKSRRDKKDNCQDMNYRDKNNRNKKDELEKREKVCHTADYVTKSRRDKQDNCQDKNYSDKNNRNKKEELEKREEVSHTTDDYVTKSRRDKKDNCQDMNYRDKNNRNKKDELEKREKVCHTADYVTKSRRDKEDNYQDKNYSDKNNRNKKDKLKKREVSHATDDYVTKSRWDKKDNRDKNYNEDNRNKKDQREKREVSHRTDDYATKSHWDKRDNHRDKNCHDKRKDAVQKGLKIDVIVSNRQVEENIPAQISDYSNVQSNPTATTLLESRKCDSNGTQNAVTKTVSENQHNSDRQAVPLGQLHLNTAPKEEKALHKNSPFISNYQNPNFLLPESKKKPLDTLNRMDLKKHLAVKLMAKDGSAGQRKLEAQEAIEQFLHPIGMPNDIKTVPFKSDCSVTSLRENLRIIDNSDKYWTHLAGLHYHIVLRKERLLKTSTNVNEFDLVEEVQGHYSVLNAMILGKLDVADGPKHMQILRQWLQQSNVNSTMTSTIGFSFNYVFNYDSALEIDYPEVIQRFSNDGTFEQKLEIWKMLRIGTDVCNDRGWTERLKHHRSLYDAVIISSYSADSIEQFKKNYSQLEEKTAEVSFKCDTIYETSSKEESWKPNSQLQIVNSYAAEQQPPQGHNFPYVGQYNTTPYCTNNSGDFSAYINCSNFMIPNNVNLGAVQTYSGKNVPREFNQLSKAGGESKQEDDPHATETQHLHCATGGAVELQPGLRPYLSGKRKWGGERNNIHTNKWRNQRVALMNTPLQHQSPPANLLPFPYAQGVEPMQPPHGVNFASGAQPCNIPIPPPIMIPLVKNLDSSILVPATAYKLFEPAGVDFLRTLCEQTNLKIDFIKEQDVSTVQYLCTLQGPDEEKPKAKAAIIKFCNGRGDVGS